MARLLKSERMVEPPRGRRLSFKTRSCGERKATVRAVRVTVPSNSVAAIASKFNAVVVGDESKGRALIKKLQTGQGSVKEAVERFETLKNGPKVVLVRANSAPLDKPPSPVPNDESDAKGESKDEKSFKPRVHPKPNISRRNSPKYVKKEMKLFLSKDKRFSLPRTMILDEVLNESTENLEDNVEKHVSHKSILKSVPHDIERAKSHQPKNTDTVDIKITTRLHSTEDSKPNSSSLHSIDVSKPNQTALATSVYPKGNNTRLHSSQNRSSNSSDQTKIILNHSTAHQPKSSTCLDTKPNASRLHSVVDSKPNISRLHSSLHTTPNKPNHSSNLNSTENISSLHPTSQPSKIILHDYENAEPKTIIDEENYLSRPKDLNLIKPNNSFLWSQPEPKKSPGDVSLSNLHKKSPYEGSSPSKETTWASPRHSLTEDNCPKSTKTSPLEEVASKLNKTSPLEEIGQKNNNNAGYTEKFTKHLRGKVSPEQEAHNFNNLKESSVDEKENVEVNERIIEEKENLEKLETPVIRTGDKKGYGLINVQGNTSSLYRNLLKQSLVDEIKERIGGKDRKGSPKAAVISKDEVLKGKTMGTSQQKSDDTVSERNYEDIAPDNYEDIAFENSYDVIDEEEAIYDDVLNTVPERIYESIYNLRVQGDSDSSCEQSNSLYDARPPSQASSGSGAVVGGTSRSDTSDDWVDIELEAAEDQKEQILVLQTQRVREEGWSSKVRRQWSTRSARQTPKVAITSPSILYIKYDDATSFEPEESRDLVHPFPLITKGLVSLREVWFSGAKYEVQEVTIFIINKDDSDSSSKHYELIDTPDDDSALCDDFDDSSDSEFSEVDITYKPDMNDQQYIREEPQVEGIYGLMKQAGEKMRKTSSTIGKSLRRISRIRRMTTTPDLISGNNGLSRGRWPSFKKKPPQVKSTSTFYLCEDSKTESAPPPPPPRPPPPAIDPRRLSISARPTSPPPPPPLLINGDSKSKIINDTSLYAECGLFEQNPLSSIGERRSMGNSWYSEIGLYENNKPFDTSSEHESSQGSDLDLRFADEPLYQIYSERAAKHDLSEDVSETGYEEIGENRTVKTKAVRPSCVDLVSSEMPQHRTLWCNVPQVKESRILDSLTPERKRLQEAKFEVLTSEASYYKSLIILEKHFAASPLLKDEAILEKVHYKTLFGNFSAVRKCSEAVLAALEKCWQESILLEGISNVIIQVAEEYFSAYIKYCRHQKGIETTLQKLKKNLAFMDALETLRKSPQCHNLPFYSFVMLPMQRITRMPLLLDAILTKLTPADPEYESCRLALAKLNKVVHECNEQARQTERLEEMALLYRALNFPSDIRALPLLSASRWLVRSGDLIQVSLEPKTTFSRKLTAPRSHKLRLFLFTDYLIVTKKKGDDNFTVVTYCERNLVQMTDVEEAIPNRFLIMLTLLKNHEGKTQEMVVCCGGENSRARWIAALSPPTQSNPGETLYEDWDCPQVRASHAYLASQPDEINLQEFDVINVHKKTADGWYYGERTRDAEKGWFPGNHTVEIVSSHVRARNLKQRYRLLALSSNFIQKQQMNKALSAS